MMRILFVFFLLLTSCGSNRDSSDFEHVPFKWEIEEDEEVITGKLIGTDFPISFIFFNESGHMFIEINGTGFLLPEFDLPLDGFTSNSNRFRLFKRAEEYVLIYPVFSEEFPAFQVIGFNRNNTLTNFGCHRYSFEDVEKSHLQFGDETYFLEEVNDTLRVYREGSPKILLSDLSFWKEKFERMSTREKKKLKILRSLNGMTNSFANNFINSTINYRYILKTQTHDYSNNWDFDGDGKKDSIRFEGDNGAHLHFYLVVGLSSKSSLQYFDWVYTDTPLLEPEDSLPEKSTGYLGVNFVVHDFNNDKINDIFINVGDYHQGLPLKFDDLGFNDSKIVLCFDKVTSSFIVKEWGKL